MKWRFALRFLAAFAVLVVAWWISDFAVFYRTVALWTTQWLSPLTNGWTLLYGLPDLGEEVVYRRGPDELPLYLDLQTLSMSLMPYLSLVAATPGLGWKRGFVAVFGGSVAFFFVHIAVLLAYPFILDDPNLFKETLGVFSGLVAFVGAPLALWFVFTYPALRRVWGLTQAAGGEANSAAD
jgi:hypothetical protein